MAVRLHRTPGWRQVTLFREVPESGRIHVTLALTGLGTAYFDDVKIEPLLDPNDPGTAPKSLPVPVPAVTGTPMPDPTPAGAPMPIGAPIPAGAGQPQPINQPNRP